MPIVWRDAMGVGHARIDSDHKQLIKLINEFEAATTGGRDVASINVILSALVRYTEEHFAREEEVQRLIRYPFHESHRKVHSDMIREAVDMQARYNADPTSQKSLAEIAAFLRDWLVKHIIEQDLRMRPFVANIKATLAVPPAS